MKQPVTLDTLRRRLQLGACSDTVSSPTKRAEDLEEYGDVVLFVAQTLAFRRLWNILVPSFLPQAAKIRWYQIVGVRLLQMHLDQRPRGDTPRKREQRHNKEVKNGLEDRAIGIGLAVLVGEAIAFLLRRQR